MVDQRRANRASREPDSPISRDVLIAFRVRDQTGEETFFEIKRVSPMEELFATYAKLQGVNASSLRFLLRGEKVEPYDTAFSIQLEDDGTINVMLEQTGC
jgi:small ubiquitin-related modifier